MTEQKYKAGDLVTFRLVGQADVNMMNDGTRNFKVLHYNQIVRHEPAQFDWADVKPGMGFTDCGSPRNVWFYIGPTQKSGRSFFTDDSFFGSRGAGYISTWDNDSLTRAPEHDKKEMM